MFHLWKAHPKDLRLRQLCAPQGSIRSCASLHVSFHSWDPYKPYILWHNERDFTNTTSATPNPRTKKIETNFVGLVDARSTKNFNLTLPTIHILQKCPRLGREVTNLGQTFPAWHQHCNSWNMSCSLAIEGFILWFRGTPASSWLQAFATAYMRFAKSYQKLESKTCQSSWRNHAWASKSLIFLAFARNGWNGWNGWYWERLQAEKVKWHDVMTWPHISRLLVIPTLWHLKAALQSHRYLSGHRLMYLHQCAKPNCNLNRLNHKKTPAWNLLSSCHVISVYFAFAKFLVVSSFHVPSTYFHFLSCPTMAFVVAFAFALFKITFAFALMSLQVYLCWFVSHGYHLSF